MVRGPLGRGRKMAKPELVLEVFENPVPTGDNEETPFPKDLIDEAMGNNNVTVEDLFQQRVAEALVEVRGFTGRLDDIEVSKDVDYKRGLGQTTAWTLKAPADNVDVVDLGEAVQSLIDDGFLFRRAVVK